jgi:hypothetical protein
MFKLLFGYPPPLSVTEQIDSLRLHQQHPERNIFDVPFFAKKRVISDDLCQILVHLLHKNNKYRYQNLE